MKGIKIESLNSVFDNSDKGKFVTKDKEIKNFPQEVVYISTSEITPGKFQPRKKFDEDTLRELSVSIKINGLLQPILVKQNNTTCNYEIVAGERRWRASKMAGISHIPCIIIDVDSVTCSSFALLENIQRDALTPLEEAKAYQQLVEVFALTHEEISKKTGRSRTSITNSIRLLSLSKDVSTNLEDGKISVGHAKVILSCDVKKRDYLHKQIINKGLSVRASELLLKKIQLSENELSKMETYLSHKFVVIKNRLKKIFGHEVKIKVSLNGGVNINISMVNMQELEKILDKIHEFETKD